MNGVANADKIIANIAKMKKNISPSLKEGKPRVFYLHTHSGKALKTITFSSHGLTKHLTALTSPMKQRYLLFQMKEEL